MRSILLKRAHVASFPQAHGEVATLKSTNLLLKPALLFLAVVCAAGRAAAVSASGAGVSSVGFHLAFAMWFLQRESC